jgi:SH3-like domain-containing protein
MRLFFAAFIFIVSFVSVAVADKQTPYFASIRVDEANVRTGPNVRYPIRWVYKKTNWPVKVTAIFENWRRIEDIYGEAGWIHERLLTGRRNIITTTDGVQEVYKLPLTTSQVIAFAESGVIAKLDFCKNQWCKIEIKNLEAWIQSKYLWGIVNSEVEGVY